MQDNVARVLRDRLVGDRGGGPSSWPVFRGRGGVESVLGRTLKWLFSASKNLRDSRCVCRAARARSWLVAEQRPEEAPSATRPGHLAGVGGTFSHAAQAALGGDGLRLGQAASPAP